MTLTLYGILDPQIAHGRALPLLARAAAEAGATLLQYRAKALETRAMVAEARHIVAALAGTGVPLLINDRVDVALASGAAGVHLGREDMAVEDARRLLPEGAIIGVTIKNRQDIVDLTGKPLDYGCIGGVFATRHKENADAPLGLSGFSALRAAARDAFGPIPVGAIAGIDASNAASVIKAGADGIAVIGALFDGDDVAASARSLLAAIKAASAFSSEVDTGSREENAIKQQDRI